METTMVKGVECVVVHLVEGVYVLNNPRFIRQRRFCDGERVEAISENERRPLTLCEDCRLKVLRWDGKNVEGD